MIYLLFSHSKVNWHYLNVVFVFSLCFSFLKILVYHLLGYKSYYAGMEITVYDLFYNLFPIIPIVLAVIYSRLYFILWVVLFYFVLSGISITGGKLFFEYLIIFVFSLSLLFSSKDFKEINKARFVLNRSAILILLTLLTVVVLNYNQGLVDFFSDYELHAVSYKLSQLNALLVLSTNLDPSSSTGNLYYEFVTIFSNFLEGNSLSLLYGSGLGGSFHDYNSYLLSSSSAYTDDQISTGLFYKFHLPLTSFFAWGGAVGLLLFLYLCYIHITQMKNFDIHSIYALSSFIVFLFTIGFIKENYILFVITSSLVYKTLQDNYI